MERRLSEKQQADAKSGQLLAELDERSQELHQVVEEKMRQMDVQAEAFREQLDFLMQARPLNKAGER